VSTYKKTKWMFCYLDCITYSVQQQDQMLTMSEEKIHDKK